MSQYKTALRQQQAADSPEQSKYRVEAQKLQEWFPSWTNDGNAEQWGSVSRKKDKKTPPSAHASKESPARGDTRGVRGGRGGRGGPGRGGAVRGRSGPSRGGAVNGRGSRVEIPAPAEADDASSLQPLAKDASESADASAEPVALEPTGQQNGVATSASSSQLISPPAASSTALTGTGSAPSWAVESELNGSAALASNKPASTPATSKKSWAQIARPQEKPAPPPTAVVPAVATVPSQPSAQVPQLAALQPEAELLAQKWEEPTTVQAPIWEDEPQSKPATSATEAWPSTSVSEEPQPEQVQHDAQVEVPKEVLPAEPEKQQLPASKSEPAPIAPQATPVISQAAVAATPSPKLSVRPTASAHRSSARYKNIDQPVVMPSSFGSGIEKVGMQFGSLSLGGDSFLDSNAPEQEAPVPAPETPSQPAPTVSVPTAQEQPAAPSAPAPAAPSVSSGVTFSQQPAQPPTTVQQPLHNLPSSVSQPSQQLPAHITAAASPIQQFTQQQAQHLQTQHQQAQQHSLGSVHQQPLLQQQHVQQPQHTPQSHSQYAQHGLPTHLDPSQQSLHSQQQGGSHSNYFGGRGETSAASAPYFHTSTPPAGQAQDTPYGSFGQLSAQPQHQQASHLAGFGQDYNAYGDNQRGFYDTYQQGAFGNRNVLGHEDVKGLPGGQQQPQTTGNIPPANAQGSQPHGSLQAGGQPQPASAQAPQGYSVPYPYYTYPQSQQFYGYNPPYGAVPQFKYPAIYQPPSGPASAPSPVSKQPGAGVQGNPYNQGLYPQGGYDEYQPHHHSQHSQQHTLGLNQGGVAASDYGKPLYGGGNLGIQGFMGPAGQSTGGAGGPTSNAGGPRGAGSPETPYKPYSTKDVGGVATGRGASQQGQNQGQPQGQGHGGQVPQGQGFYGGARFGAGAGGISGTGGPQQGAHHPQNGPQGHPGYPQSANDGNFYQYRGQQQGYWQ
ncbi:hypothetical protein H0H93_015704 [Arthromyces matolae]|nr:hypothetical protein H0H93_015704 [Arthromyces matolae]